MRADTQWPTRGTSEESSSSRRTVLSIVVPTRNEAANVAQLVSRISVALDDFEDDWEIVFVDDSDDSTPAVIASLAEAGRPVRIVHREPGERSGGLSGAVLEGFAASDAAVLVVMDADLQHPPELLPQLVAPILAEDADVVVATRYAGTGTAGGLDGVGRRVISSGSRRVVQLVLPRSRAATDPLGGFFALRRDVVDGVGLQPDGFKILLEILTRGRWRRLDEVPYDFAAREGGESKAGIREGVRFAGHLASLVAPEPLGTAPGRLARVGRVVTSAPVRIALAVALTVAAYWYSLGSLVSAWNPSDARTVAGTVPFIAAVLVLARSRPRPDEPGIHDRQVDYLLGIAALGMATFMLVILPRRMDVAFWVDRVDMLALPIFVAGVVAVLFGTRAMWRVRWPLVFAFLAWPAITAAAAARLSEPLRSSSLDATRTLSHAFGLPRVTLTASTTTTMVLLALIAGLALVIWVGPGLSRAIVWLGSIAVVAWCANVVRLVVVHTLGASGRTGLARSVSGSIGFFVTTGLVVGVGGWILLAGTRRDRATPRTYAEHRSPAVLRPGLAIGLVSVVAVATGVVTSGYGRFEAVVGPLGNAKVQPLGTEPISVPGFVAVAHRGPGSRSTSERRRFGFERVDAPEGAAPFVVDAFPVTDPGDSAASSLRGVYPLGGAVLLSSRSVGLGDGRHGDLVEFRQEGRSWKALSWVWPVRGAEEPYERIVISGRELQSATASLSAPSVDAAGPDAGDARSLRALATSIVRTELEGTPSDVDRAEGRR